MSNAYYQNTGFPTYGSQASSSVMRAELVKIQAAFDKLPAPAGFAYALVQVKGDESGLTATGVLVDAAGKMILPAGIAVSSGGAVIVGPAEVSGDTTLANVTINGTLNMNAGTVGTITGLSEPVLDSDAATKGYVVAAINALVDSAPGTLDTLNEIAAALGDDPNLAATLNAEIATKLPKAGGAMSGQIDMAGNKITGLAAPASGTDAVRLQYVTDLFGSTASAAASAQVATTQAGIATAQAGIATTKAQEAADSAAQAAAAAPVQSVAGKTGHVALTKADVGLANVDNTSDLNKPVSTAVQAKFDALPAPTAFASAAENAAGTIQNKAVDPLGIREAFNATGSAPVYACRAWVNFNGASAAIRASGNVSSITDNGIGDYTINFTTAMPDANYSVSGGAGPGAASDDSIFHPFQGATPTVSAMRCQTRTSSGVLVDYQYVSANFFR